MLQYILVIHLNLDKPPEQRLREGWECGGVHADCTTRSQSLHSTAIQRSPEYCSTFIRADGCTGSRLAHCAVLGITGRGCRAQQYIICCHTPTQSSSVKLLHRYCLKNKRINVPYWKWHRAGCRHTVCVLLDAPVEFHRRKDDYEKGKTLAAFCLREIRGQRDSQRTFLAGESLKLSRRLISPRAASSLIPRCFSIKHKVAACKCNSK